jgi:N-succinyldiaminopimelate aminotransferase
MSLDDWKTLFDLSDRYGFVIAADECYSEIYLDAAHPPVGALEAAQYWGRSDYRRLVVLGSLSKRSNLPGLRSGYAAGDAEIMKRFTLYRTYHGSAMNPSVQSASLAAWQDEAHVIENRKLYREKFLAFRDILKDVQSLPLPDAGFYYWMKTPMDDETFVRELYRSQHLTVLPGSYLGREVLGTNPGRDHVRIALVGTLDETREAAHRMRQFLTQ